MRLLAANGEIPGDEMSEYRKAKRRVDASIGESVRIVRELQGLSQSALAAASGIPQSTISAIERDRINLGVERRNNWLGHSSAILQSSYFQAGMLSTTPQLDLARARI